MKRASIALAKLLIALVVCATLGWSALAVHYDALVGDTAKIAAIVVYLSLCCGIFCFVRPFLRALCLYCVLFALVLLWWFNIKPQMNRNWALEYSELPSAEINGNLLTIHNLRDFEYRSETDFTPHWETRTYDLSKVVGVDMFFSHWGSPNIAHTIASWEFDDGSHLAISIETRREKGETYSSVAGFFRQYELYYVVADERDLIGLRTNYRDEDVYLYRLGLTSDKARAGLVDYLETINQLSKEAKWYNAFFQNCTTTIRQHASHVGAQGAWNWRMLVNGHLDELYYRRGGINNTMSFEELKDRSHVNAKALASGLTPEFAKIIRNGLPQRPSPINVTSK